MVTTKRYELEGMFIFMFSMLGWLSTGPVTAIVVVHIFNITMSDPFWGYVAFWVGWFGAPAAATISVIVKEIKRRI